MPVAFAPGRVNLIGEHTDYNDGLSLPFAIARGVCVAAEPGGDDVRVTATASPSFPLRAERRERTGDWRDFVSGAIGELIRAGFELHGCTLEIARDLPVA